MVCRLNLIHLLLLRRATFDLVPCILFGKLAGSMVSQDVVVNALRKLLQQSDINTVTTRKLVAELEGQLHCSMTEYKQLIKDEIERYLEGLEDDEEDGAEEQQQVNNKRSHAAAFHSDVKHTADLSQRRKANVKEYNGVLLLDLREFNVGAAGELKATPKGISLTTEQVAALAEGVAALTRGLEAGDTAVQLQLSSKRVARVSDYGNKLSIDVREMYDKDGELAPGKKGLSLSAEEWSALVDALPTLQQHLAAGAGPGGTCDAKQAAKKAKPDSVPAPAAAGAGTREASLGPSGYIELSKARRADVSAFKGTKYVNIREYYEKDGEWRPGQKGIALPAAQFDALYNAADDVDEAFVDRNESYSLQLAAKRRVSISAFKNQYFVNIREYYEKDGTELPGKKGISLSGEQWKALKCGLPALKSKLHS